MAKCNLDKVNLESMRSAVFPTNLHAGDMRGMAYHRGQNSTFEFDVVVYNFYLDLQLNIQVSYFSTLLVDLTLFVSRFNFVELPLLAPTKGVI